MPNPPPHLPPDQLPWLAVAQDVLNGKFDRADSSTKTSITIGLRSIPHPSCKKALDRLNPTKKP